MSSADLPSSLGAAPEPPRSAPAFLGLRARDVMGYTFLVFLVLSPVVLTLVTVLGATLPYPL